MIVPAAHDAFGRALLDHFEGRPVAPLTLELDDGTSTPAMDPAWFFQQPSAWDPWERAALATLSGPVLDLGSGAGRASLHLLQKGLDVTAVDSSPGAIDVCRRQGLVDVRELDFVEQLPTDKKWGAILLLCGNLGLAGGWDETRRLLRSLWSSCRPGATIVADTVDPTIAADAHARDYQRKKVAAGQYIGNVTLRLTYGEVVSPWWNQTNFVVGDVVRLIAGTGWVVEDHHVPGVDHYLKLKRT